MLIIICECLKVTESACAENALYNERNFFNDFDL